MYTSTASLYFSISVFHARDFRATYADPNGSGIESWNPVGPVGNTSYTRIEY
jgi:hypothetical protein